MTSPQSAPERVFADRTLDGTEQLAVFVEAQRTMLRATLDGLSEDEVRSRLVPSATTLLGLVKHATFLQVVWYQEAVSGTPRTRLGQPAAVDDSFALAPTDTITSVLADYDRVCEVAREVETTIAADHVVTGHRLGAMTVRWIQLQVLRELAQHTGHADILREQLLAAREPRTPVTAPRPRLLMITGPIAAGKSTLAAEVARLLRETGRSVALTDLDTVAEMALPTLPSWDQAHAIHAQLVGAWCATDVDVVVDEGTSTPEEVQQVRDRLPAGSTIFPVVLTADYDASLARARGDEGRGLSKEPAFLRADHDAYAQHLPNLPGSWRLHVEGRTPTDLARDVLDRFGI
jgi:energy-coupling factor transporter ATP-binding protein EcfA2